MRLMPYIHSDLVIAGLPGSDHQAVLSGLAAHYCRVFSEMDAPTLLNKLLEREKVSATGLEGGVAVPHTTLEGTEKTICCVASLAQPVDFGALDHEPVEIVFLLISPPNTMATHIRLLARIARLCSQPDFIDALKAAPDNVTLYKVLSQEDDSHV